MWLGLEIESSYQTAGKLNCINTSASVLTLSENIRRLCDTLRLISAGLLPAMRGSFSPSLTYDISHRTNATFNLNPVVFINTYIQFVYLNSRRRDCCCLNTPQNCCLRKMPAYSKTKPLFFNNDYLIAYKTVNATMKVFNFRMNRCTHFRSFDFVGRFETITNNSKHLISLNFLYLIKNAFYLTQLHFFLKIEPFCTNKMV